jgi:DNA polymerase
MNIITLDFETYYAKDFSLTKLTTEEYIRDGRFEVIGVAVKENDGETKWFTGTYGEVSDFLHSFDWANSALLAHNTSFDGAILAWNFGIKPKALFDTLCMARAIHGVDAGGSLAALVERYNLGRKGTEVLDALGKYRKDFKPADLAQYGEYCKNDVELTWALFNTLLPKFPSKELKVIDITLKMFTEPVLELNLPLLEQHLEDTKDKKERLLEACLADKDTLMSNDKFAEILRSLAVEPPTKTSLKTNKEAWAFAKTDEGFKELASHPDVRVQALVAARLGNKSTLEETRTQRFIDIAKRGKLPVPIKYYAAHTGRWGGEDKINLQNLPSRGQNGGKLKKAIVPPEGHIIIDCDSAQIEARIVAWLAGQIDLVDAFEKGEDVYKIMAASIYAKDISKVTAHERFVGKTTILGCGYGMGSKKFQAQLKAFNVEIEEAEAIRIIQVYRTTYGKIPELWKLAGRCLDSIYAKKPCDIKLDGIIEFDHVEKGFLLPSGLWQKYETLEQITDPEGNTQYQYKTRRGAVKLYGGKVVENLCQALARCVIAEQMVRIAKRYRVVLTVHDAVACIAPEAEAQEAKRYIEECMGWRPSWAKTLPLNCESGMGKSYGEC